MITDKQVEVAARAIMLMRGGCNVTDWLERERNPNAAQAWAEARAALEAAQPQWQPIETAPELDRVFVAGWQPKSGDVAGYWWWHEDTIHDGGAAEHWQATLWCQIDIPDFPSPPLTQEGE